MMKKDDLIKQCRYYGGEEQNPYEAGDKVMLWNWERTWVDMAANEDGGDALTLQSYVKDFEENGLKDFEAMDGVPISMKAVLFNRYYAWNEYTTIVEFKKWYRTYYHLA